MYNKNFLVVRSGLAGKRECLESGGNSSGSSHTGPTMSYLHCRASAEPAPSCWANSLLDPPMGGQWWGDRTLGISRDTRAIQPVVSLFPAGFLTWLFYLNVCLFYFILFFVSFIFILSSFIPLCHTAYLWGVPQMVRESILFWKWAAGECLGISHPGLSVRRPCESLSGASTEKRSEYLMVFLSTSGDNQYPEYPRVTKTSKALW